MHIGHPENVIFHVLTIKISPFSHFFAIFIRLYRRIGLEILASHISHLQPRSGNGAFERLGEHESMFPAIFPWFPRTSHLTSGYTSTPPHLTPHASSRSQTMWDTYMMLLNRKIQHRSTVPGHFPMFPKTSHLSSKNLTPVSETPDT